MQIRVLIIDDFTIACIGRFTMTNNKDINPGFESIHATLGPMGRSVDDLELATRVACDATIKLARTQEVLPLLYRTVQLPKVLKFGYYTTDRFCKTSPVCRRAVMETVDALRKQGHECVEFTPISRMCPSFLRNFNFRCLTYVIIGSHLRDGNFRRSHFDRWI